MLDHNVHTKLYNAQCLCCSVHGDKSFSNTINTLILDAMDTSKAVLHFKVLSSFSLFQFLKNHCVRNVPHTLHHTFKVTGSLFLLEFHRYKTQPVCWQNTGGVGIPPPFPGNMGLDTNSSQWLTSRRSHTLDYTNSLLTFIYVPMEIYDSGTGTTAKFPYAGFIVQPTKGSIVWPQHLKTILPLFRLKKQTGLTVLLKVAEMFAWSSRFCLLIMTIITYVNAAFLLGSSFFKEVSVGESRIVHVGLRYTSSAYSTKLG